jgi:hypothetical protein
MWTRTAPAWADNCKRKAATEGWRAASAGRNKNSGVVESSAASCRRRSPLWSIRFGQASTA